MSEDIKIDPAKEKDLGRGWEVYRRTLYDLMGLDVPHWGRLSWKVRKAFLNGVMAYNDKEFAAGLRGRGPRWCDFKKEVARVLAKYPGEWVILDRIRQCVMDNPGYSDVLNLEVYKACQLLVGSPVEGWVFEQDRDSRRTRFRGVREAKSAIPIYHGAGAVVSLILQHREGDWFSCDDIVALLMNLNPEREKGEVIASVVLGLDELRKEGPQGWSLHIKRQRVPAYQIFTSGRIEGYMYSEAQFMMQRA